MRKPRSLEIFRPSLIVLMTILVTATIDAEGRSISKQEPSCPNSQSASKAAIQMTLEELFCDKQVRELAQAASRADLDRVRQLVWSGVSVNSTGTNGATPLYWAMRNFDGFKELLELGADPNLSIDGSSVLHWIAGLDDVRFMQAALDHSGKINLEDSDGQTPIFYAVKPGSGALRMINLLISAGANINVQSKSYGTVIRFGGDTAMFTAAVISRYDIVYLFLTAGADYTLANAAGLTLWDQMQMQRNSATFVGHDEYFLRVESWLASHNALTT